MKFVVKFLDPETNVFLPADVNDYEAATELDALRLFAETRRNDIDVEDLTIVSENPFRLRIKGWTEADDGSKFELTEDVYEYIAQEKNGE